MADPTGVADRGALRLDFDRRLMIQFRGSAITSDGGLLAYRELDDALALTASGGERLAEARTGKNRRHFLVGLLRQSVFGRLAGYEDVNDADRLCRDPTMRWVVGGAAPMGRAASASQMGRFETEWLVRSDNVAALASGSTRCTSGASRRSSCWTWIRAISPTYGEQERSAYNGHFGCTCYHPLFVFNQLGDLDAAPCGPETSIRLMAGGRFWSRSCRATGAE
jgi:Transposase DDE domain group 1